MGGEPPLRAPPPPGPRASAGLGWTAAATGKPEMLLAHSPHGAHPACPRGWEGETATVWNSTGLLQRRGRKALYPQTCFHLRPMKQPPSHADTQFPSVLGDSSHLQLHSLSRADILPHGVGIRNGFPVTLKGRH